MSALEYSLVYDEKKTSKVFEDDESRGQLFLHEIDGIKIAKESHPEFTREYSRTLGGPSFFISLYESQFYHFLSDGLAQFLWIKSFIPDLKIYFINDQPNAVTSALEATKKDFVDWIVRWCQEEDFGGEIINLVSYKKIVADKVFILANSNVTFLRERVGLEDSRQIGDISNNPVPKGLMLPLLKEFIYKKALENNRLPKDFNYPKRVYLRPGLTFERLQAWKDQVDYMKNNGVVFDKNLVVVEDPNNIIEELSSIKDWKHFIHTSAGINGVIKEIHDRYLSPEEVALIDDFFSRRDYETLDSQHMAWIDILNIVIRAEKVALVAGAAVLNAMIAEEGTQVIYLEFNTAYDFDHVATMDMFFVNPKPIIYYDRREVFKKRFPVARVLEDLEKEKGDYL